MRMKTYMGNEFPKASRQSLLLCKIDSCGSPLFSTSSKVSARDDCVSVDIVWRFVDQERLQIPRIYTALLVIRMNLNTGILAWVFSEVHFVADCICSRIVVRHFTKA